MKIDEHNLLKIVINIPKYMYQNKEMLIQNVFYSEASARFSGPNAASKFTWTALCGSLIP